MQTRIDQFGKMVYGIYRDHRLGRITSLEMSKRIAAVNEKAGLLNISPNEVASNALTNEYEIEFETEEKETSK
jgi:hypothetical protein